MDEETYYRAMSILYLLRAEIFRAGNLIDEAENERRHNTAS